jgi:CRISPR-associated protein Cst1
MEKIYLGDWLYNAGIVGFLRINSHLWNVKDTKLISKDENLLKIGDNYIEIDRKIFDGFTDRFFDYAFNLYGRHERKLKRFKELLENLNDGIFKDVYKDFKREIDGYTLLKNKLGDIKAENSQELKHLIEKAIRILEQDKEEFVESDVQIFLRDFYGQKSFLNKTITQDRKKKFYEDFEEPLKTNNNQKDKKLTCVICGERPAKKDTNYDTGFSPVFGLNKDAVNFAWNFNTKLPSCDICEIVYFCYFAGLTELNGKYYFVNLDDYVESLMLANNLFKEEIEKSPENPFIDFFTEYLLRIKKSQAKYTLSNINFLETELKETLPKVFSFNIDYNTAEFIEENHKNLKSLSKSFFILPDKNKTRVYILTEFLNLILKKDLNYGLLYKIFKSIMQDKAYVSNYNLQRLIIMYLLYKQNLYKQKVGGKEMGLEEKSLWAMYMQGKNLLERLKERDAENKIQSIAYKLLNALKIGDTNQFMDVMMRVHMAYDLEVPGLLIKALQDKDNFYLLGYSFLNGLLGKENKLQEENQ